MNQIIISHETASKIASVVGNGITANEVIEVIYRPQRPKLTVNGFARSMRYGLDLPIETVARILKDCLDLSATEVMSALKDGLPLDTVAVNEMISASQQKRSRAF